MPTPQYEPKVPSPTNTKKAAKRTKHTFGPRQSGLRVPNPVGLIYRKTTGCIVADEATEARLGRLGSGLREYTFINR